MTNFTKTNKTGLFARFTWMDTVFLLTVGVLLVWSLVMAIIAGTYLEFAPFATLVRIFFIMLVLRGIFYSRGTLIFTGAVAAVAMLILLFDALLFTPAPVQMLSPDAYAYAELYEYLHPYRETARQYHMFAEIVNFISGTIGFVTGFEFYTAAYDAAIQWSLAIGLSIFVFVFGFFWFNFFAILSTVLIFGLVLNTGFFFYNLAFYVFIFSIVAYLIRHLNLRSMGKERKNSPFALYALPFTAVCLAVAIALPTPQAGAAEQFTDNFIRRPFSNINENLQSAFAPRHFSLAQTGFGMGSTRRLGGNVTANYDTFMRINHPGPIYITGNVFDRYTGFSWINSFDEEYYVLDFNELGPNIEAFERLTSQFTMNLADDFIEVFVDAAENSEENLRLWYAGVNFFGLTWMQTVPRPETPQQILAIATDAHLEESRLLVEHDIRKFTVFTTGLVSNIVPPDAYTNFLRDINGSVQSDVLLPRHARYVIYYANLPADVDWAALLSESRQGLYRDIYNRVTQAGFNADDLIAPMRSLLYFRHNNISIRYDRLLRDYLIPRADRINEVYTALPGHLPERISELAHYVVTQAGATTNLEKAIVLEDFLRNRGGLSYSLTPGNTPIDRDFIDHFLFDLQEGYCTHFASSFVIMARSVGLPTRYVEGFIVSGDADVYGYLSVINRQGHAWAEVYFEGFGWHRFDPTPPAAIFTWPEAHNPGFFYDDWYEHLDLVGHNAPWSGHFPEYWDEIYMYQDGMAAMGMIMNNGAAPAFSFSVSELIAWSLLITIALAIVLMGGRVAYFETRKMAITKKGNNEAAIAYFYQILRYMNLFRFEIEPHETAIAFGKRVGKRVGFENERTLMIDLSRIFSRARYGTEEISDEDRHLMAASVKALDRRLLGYMGPRKYVLYKYIMCLV